MPVLLVCSCGQRTPTRPCHQCQCANRQKRSIYSTARYRRERTALLATNPPCHWCNQPATTADHLIPLHQGGHPFAPNLVPACKKCNSKRGQALT